MKKKFAEEEIEWIDVHDDALMVSFGMRPKDYVRPDFTKTDKEKAILKRIRTKNDMRYSGRSNSKKLSHTCYDKLIVTIPKHTGDTTNTFSHKCFEYEIPGILRMMYPDYVKYYFNGRTHFAV